MKKISHLISFLLITLLVSSLGAVYVHAQEGSTNDYANEIESQGTSNSSSNTNSTTNSDNEDNIDYGTGVNTTPNTTSGAKTSTTPSSQGTTGATTPNAQGTTGTTNPSNTTNTVKPLNTTNTNTTNSGGTLNGSNSSSGGSLNGSSALPTLRNPLKNVSSVSDLLYKLVDLLIFVGVIVAIFMFIFIGFKFVWAQGDPKGLQEARSWFVYAVIGTAILISSKVIVDGIKNTLTSAGVVDEKIWNNKL
jgi:hypothetical protein